jgi:hypothetical protein
MNADDVEDAFLFSYWRTRRKVLKILRNQVPGSVYYQYRNVSECSLFHRYVIQVFKDFVTECCAMNNFIAE